MSQIYIFYSHYIQQMRKNGQGLSVFWFRRDLRIEDNAGLFHALSKEWPVLPLFIFDTDILEKLNNKADRRVDFIYQTLKEIDRKLRNIGSSLLIKHGKPLDVFKQLQEDFELKAVFTNRDYEPYALKRDEEIHSFLKSQSVPFFTFKDQVIFEHDEVLKVDGNPYTIFTPYSVKWKSQLTQKETEAFPTENLNHRFVQNNEFSFPTLNETGFSPTGINYHAPEIDTELLKNYDKTRNFPAIRGTSELSAHIRFGTVSIRKLIKAALTINEIWLNELIWREFFMNILRHFPHVETNSFRKNYDNIEWRNDEREFERWCVGKTGYPLVDAGMRQLNETGWMHNRVRMVTASFLTKHLLIDWRWGEAYFAEKLLDYDLAANNGNWQWASGSGCDAAPYFRIFNPQEQTKKFDPGLEYIRHWIPEYGTKQYPEPIVEQSLARERALKTYKAGIQ